jgi:hypothetical protein
MKISLISLLTCHIPIQDSVLRQLEIRDVISLAKTAKAFRGFMKTVEKTQFNINAWLKPFFDPIAFRNLQAKHNILIAGNSAYAFLARKSMQELSFGTALRQLWVRSGDHEQALAKFLEDQGYQVQQHTGPSQVDVSAGNLMSQMVLSLPLL